MTTKGTLSKWTNYVHGWQPRYFILKNGILMYHKSEEETSFGCRGAIAVKASKLTLHEFDCCRFDVGVCDYVWYLRSETKSERDRWILALQEQRALDQYDENDHHNHNHQNNNNTADNKNLDSLPSLQQQQMQSQQPHGQQLQKLQHEQPGLHLHQQLEQHQLEQQHLQCSDNFSDAQENFEDPLDSSTIDYVTSTATTSATTALTEVEIEEATTTTTITTTTNNSSAKSMPPNNPLWPKIDQITRDQLYYAQMGLGQEGTNGWQLFAEDGQMRLYSRELEIDGLVCDPLKAVHVVRGVTGYEMCERFFSPNTRFEWEQTLESMKVVEEINRETLIFHQVHKRIWPAAQRDAVFWSHIRKVDEPRSSCLSKDDINTITRPHLKLHNVWIVCNNSTDKPEIPLGSCVRVRLTVSLVCETYVPVTKDTETATREDLTCKIIYSSTINPGGWAPAAILRAVYKREYPRFLENFSNYVIASTKSEPIVYE